MDERRVEPTPKLDERFVLGARHREPSHRQRQLEAERRRALDRGHRYRAEQDRGLEEARRAPRPVEGPPRRGAEPGPAPNRRRQVIGLVIAVSVFAAAVYLNGYGGRSALGQAAAVAQPGPCPASLYPQGAEYRFENCAAGNPIGWGDCRTLTISVNPTNAPVTWRADVDDATHQLAAATRLKFKPTSRGADITIGWVSAFNLPPNIAADKAGVTRVQTVSTAGGSRIVSAAVEISTRLGPGGGPNGEVPVLLHELAHAVGLGHYDGAVTMNPVDQGFATYQSGDMAGLTHLYRPGSCR